jgi:hypothetical protein
MAAAEYSALAAVANATPAPEEPNGDRASEDTFVANATEAPGQALG